MENSKSTDRRRNVFDIVADLGFLDRKPLPRSEQLADQPAAAPPAATPPPLTLVKPQLGPPPAPPLASRERSEDRPGAAEFESTLTEAQQRAAQQRIAAERLLQEAIELEERLAEEAAQARAAKEQALGRELAATLDELRGAEREAVERADLCAGSLERIAAQCAQAQALQADDRAARRAAAQDVTEAEALLADARHRLEIAEAACSESNLRFKDAAAAEEAARAEAAAASEAVAARRAAREDVEARLRGIHERAAVPGDAATRIAERRAADAAKRVAERQAADAERGAAS